MQCVLRNKEESLRKRKIGAINLCKGNVLFFEGYQFEIIIKNISWHLPVGLVQCITHR